MATAVTASIVNEFVEQINTEKEYDIKELKQILTDIYKAKTHSSKKTKKNNIINIATPQSPPLSPIPNNEEDDDKPKKRGRPTKPRKVDKNENKKAKRQPSAYNKFVKQRILALKPEQPDTKAKELMMIAAGEWKNLTKEEQEQYNIM